MTENVGTLDRILRLALGLGLLYLAFLSGMAVFSAPFAKYAAAAVGLIMLTTSGMRFCPLYSLLGLKTCKAC